MKQPPFSITEKIINLVTQIAEHIGKIQGSGEYGRNLHLRKINRLRSIQSSAAIEGNTLSLEQVSDVINGKRVLGNPREIREVKNAYEAYEQILNFNPFSSKDFLMAHKLMTNGLVKEAGKFRAGNVGVFSGKILSTIKFTDIFPDKITDKLSKAEKEFLIGIIGYLENGNEIDNYKAQLLTNKPAESVKKYFVSLVAAGILKVIGVNKGRKYRLA